MIDFSEFSTEIFQILRVYCNDIVLYDDVGNRVYEPAEARRMYVIGENILVSINENGDDSSLKLFMSDLVNLSQIEVFISTLRVIATRNNLLFHVRRFNKEIKPQDFATQASLNEQERVNMNLMEGMYGTSKSSYLKLENARMIVRHSERVKENVIGERGRNIQSIFIENAQGERFLFPVNILSGGRAMTQHVNQGGSFADEVGQQIIRMAQDFRNLAHVASAKAVAEPERFGGLRESIVDTMRSQKLVFARLAESRYYQKASQQIVESTSLMEDGELASKIETLEAILGEGYNAEALGTVARLVSIPESTTSVVEEEEVEIDDAEETDEPTINITVEGEQEVVVDCPNNAVIKQFNSWMEGFDPQAIEEASLQDMNSGMRRSQSSVGVLQQVLGGEEFVTTSKGKSYKAAGAVKSPTLTAGMIVLASYNSYNQGVDLVRVLGFTDSNTDDTPTFKSLKEVAAKYGVKTVRELEAKADRVAMVVEDLDDGSSGAWYYLFEGRFCRGSGAEKLSFVKMEEVAAVEEGKTFKRNDDEDEVDVKAKRKEDKQSRDDRKEKRDSKELDEARLDELDLGDKINYTDRADWTKAVKALPGNVRVDMNQATLDGKVVAKWFNDQAGGWVAQETKTVDYAKTSRDEAEKAVAKAGAFDYEPRIRESDSNLFINWKDASPSDRAFLKSIGLEGNSVQMASVAMDDNSETDYAKVDGVRYVIDYDAKTFIEESFEDEDGEDDSQVEEVETEELLLPSNQATDFRDDVTAKDETGVGYDQAYVDRLRRLAGLK